MNKLGVSLRIGKNGITLEILEEIKRQMKNKNFLKIKFLKSFVHTQNKKDAIKFIEEKLKVKVVEERGNVILIKKLRK